MKTLFLDSRRLVYLIVHEHQFNDWCRASLSLCFVIKMFSSKTTINYVALEGGAAAVLNVLPIISSEKRGAAAANKQAKPQQRPARTAKHKDLLHWTGDKQFAVLDTCPQCSVTACSQCWAGVGPISGSDTCSSSSQVLSRWCCALSHSHCCRGGGHKHDRDQLPILPSIPPPPVVCWTAGHHESRDVEREKAGEMRLRCVVITVAVNNLAAQ